MKLKKTQMDKFIDDLLDEKIDYSKSDRFLQKFFNSQEAEKIILESKGKDIQDDFRKSLKENTMVIDSINEAYVKESVDEVSKEENLTKEQAEEVKNEVQNNEEIMTNSQLKAMAVKVIYEEALDEYNKLRQDLYTGQNGQVKTGMLTNGDKMDTKLVMYQSYLRKLDMQYKGYTGVLIADGNEDVKQKETKYFNENSKSEKAVYEKSNENIERCARLNVELEEIAEDINRISANSSLMNQDEFKITMERLQNEYTQKVAELRSINPNILELREDVEAKRENDELEQKLVGSEYQKTKEAGIEVDEIEKNKQEKREEKIEEKIVNESNEAGVSILESIKNEQKMAESDFARFEATGDIDAYNSAIDHLIIAQNMAGITSDITQNDKITDATVEKNEERASDKGQDMKEKVADDMGLDRTDDERNSLLKSEFNKQNRDLTDKINEMEEKTNDDIALERKFN